MSARNKPAAKKARREARAAHQEWVPAPLTEEPKSGIKPNRSARRFMLREMRKAAVR